MLNVCAILVSTASIDVDVIGRHHLRGFFGDRTFDQRARAQEFERSLQIFGRCQRRLFALLARDIDAGTHADMHKPFHLERNQRFADGRAGYAKLFSKFTLSRQPLANGKFAALDQRAYLVCHLPV